jgi:hypothetical protein
MYIQNIKGNNTMQNFLKSFNELMKSGRIHRVINTAL